jgi:outer membrane murein-binding lipoprotein Lpp
MTAELSVSKFQTHIGLVKTVVAVVVSVVTAMWGVFRYIDNREDSIRAMTEKINEVHSTVSDLKDQQGALIIRMDEVEGQINAVNDNAVLIGNYVQGVSKAMDYHLKKSPEVTKEDYAMMMELMKEVKKNDSQTVSK